MDYKKEIDVELLRGKVLRQDLKNARKEKEKLDKQFENLTSELKEAKRQKQKIQAVMIRTELTGAPPTAKELESFERSIPAFNRFVPAIATDKSLTQKAMEIYQTKSDVIVSGMEFEIAITELAYEFFYATYQYHFLGVVK